MSALDQSISESRLYNFIEMSPKITVQTHSVHFVKVRESNIRNDPGVVSLFWYEEAGDIWTNQMEVKT